MSKPDGIPQDVWDAAREATGGWMAAGESESNAALVQSVGRAIVAERERCAKIADAYAYGGSGSFNAPIEIAAAIRKGGE